MSQWQIGEPYALTENSHALQFLSDRGIDPETFFQLGADTLHDPFLMKHMSEAALRAKQAVDNGERIRIAGDYDADGITSTYTMVYAFNLLGAAVSYEIPDRRSGYGLSNAMIDRAHASGCTLIITCDNGIACVQQVLYARTLGIDVIITDHHEPQDVIPDTLVVNPKQSDCPYPFKELAGCAVAWKFAQALLSHYGLQDRAFDLLEMVATGTVADMMELTGENRSLVAMGLESYGQPVNPGLHRLMEQMELFKYPVTTTTLGFSIGPGLNAAGRLSSAEHAVELFLTPSPIQSMRLATYIHELNEERKQWTEEFANQALRELEGSTDKVIVHAMDAIPEGIVGIIASRILKVKGRPVLLITPDATGKSYKGSGRSVPGFDLFKHLSDHRHLLEKFGGHDMACGFSLSPDAIDLLRYNLNEACTLTEEELAPVLQVDYGIEPHEVTLALAEDILRLEPTGLGNPKPVFTITDCLVTKSDFIGGNKKTLRLSLMSGGVALQGIGFNLADEFQQIQASHTEKELFVDIAFVPTVNEWRGRKSLQVELRAIRPSGQEK